MESLQGMVFGQKMDSYTTAELHAEIFYAECNMLQSLLTFFQVRNNNNNNNNKLIINVNKNTLHV